MVEILLGALAGLIWAEFWWWSVKGRQGHCWTKFENWLREINQPFNPPVWDHIGPIIFKIEPALDAISFKVNDEPWMTIDAGSRACTHALLAAAKQMGVHKNHDGECTIGGLIEEDFNPWRGAGQ